MKILLTLCASLFAITNLSAGLPVGVKMGVNGGNMINIPQGANNTTKMSFYGGVFTKFEVVRGFSIQPELIYSRQGARLNPEYISPDESGQLIFAGVQNRQIRLNYINIPVVFSYKFWDELSVSLAPQLGVNIHNIDRTIYIDRAARTRIAGVHRFDFSLGVGFEYLITPWFDVTLRYNRGLTNIFKPKFDAYSMKNGVLQLGLGFIILD